MTEEKALLTAVKLNPSDDTPKLVLADYYDEHDRPDLAVLFRLCCALNRIRVDKENDELRIEYADICLNYSRLITNNIGVVRFLERHGELIKIDVELAKWDIEVKLDPGIYVKFKPSKTNPSRQDRWTPDEKINLSDLGRRRKFLDKNMWSVNGCFALFPTFSSNWKWRKGWPSEVSLTWESWVAGHKNILANVPGLDKVTITDTPWFRAIAGNQLSELTVIPQDRPGDRTGGHYDGNIWGLDICKKSLSRKWPDVKEWNLPAIRTNYWSHSQINLGRGNFDLWRTTGNMTINDWMQFDNSIIEQVRRPRRNGF